MYNELVYHLDLCTLSYHLYAQTLVWNVDPFYETQVLKFSERRNEFIVLAKKRKKQLGWFQNHLDPIYHQFEYIDPSKHTFNRAEVKDWQVFEPQTKITDQLKKVFVMPPLKDDNDEAGLSIVEAKPKFNGNGHSSLYCFNGKSGQRNKKNNEDGNISMFGFVLHHKSSAKDPGTIHIVFRGSRSGSPYRNFPTKAYNPDWVSDLQLTDLIPDALICDVKDAKVSFGFSEVLKSCWLYIKKIFQEIHAKNDEKAPHKIFVAGHSLGGALGMHFAAAMNAGKLSEKETELKHWPWSELKLFTYGAPPAGNEVFGQVCADHFWHKRIWVSNDFVVTGKKARTSFGNMYHSGSELLLEQGDATRLKLEPHKLQIIRNRLLNRLKEHFPQDALADIPGVDENPEEGWFWKKRETLSEVLNDFTNVRSFYSGRNELAQELEIFLDILKENFGNDRSYKGHFKIPYIKKEIQDNIETVMKNLDQTGEIVFPSSETNKNLLTDIRTLYQIFTAQ
jgi:hypothetical protein